MTRLEKLKQTRLDRLKSLCAAANGKWVFPLDAGSAEAMQMLHEIYKSVPALLALVEQMKHAMNDSWHQQTGMSHLKSCGHDFECICTPTKIKEAITAFAAWNEQEAVK